MPTILIAFILMMTACADTRAIHQQRVQQDQQKYQDMLEKGARQIEQADQQAKAKKEQKEQEARDLQAYYDWYNALPYEQKMNETRWQMEQQEKKQAREDKILEQEANRQAMLEANRAQERAAAMQALGLMNQGRGILGPGYTRPAPVPGYQAPAYVPMQPRRNQTCNSMMIGNQMQTNCY